MLTTLRKKGNLKKYYTWTNQYENILMVENISYLGLSFSCMDSFVKQLTKSKGKALRSMKSLLNVTYQFDVPIYTMLDLVYAHV